MTVAHDHGYCYLHTKDVSGATFEGASDGAVACNNRHTEFVKIAETERNSEISQIFSDFFGEFFSPPRGGAGLGDIGGPYAAEMAHFLC